MYIVHIGGGPMSQPGRTPSAGVVAVLGVGTIAFFAAVGGLPRELLASDDVTFVVVMIAPIVVATTIGARYDCVRINAIARWYVLGLALAVAADVFAFRHGSVPALVVGVLPALPCFAFAWRRRREA